MLKFAQAQSLAPGTKLKFLDEEVQFIALVGDTVARVSNARGEVFQVMLSALSIP